MVPVLFSPKKEGDSDTCSNMDVPGHCAEWKKPVTKGHVVYDCTYMKSFVWSNSLKQKVKWWFLM